MRVPQLDLPAQYAALRPEIEAAVLRVLASQRFILGEEVAALESEIAAYTGAGHAIACASGTDALLLALMALDIGPGDEVITTPLTFFSTAGMMHRIGARPVFADIDPETLNLDPESVARRINSKTRAIIPVHLYGRLAAIEQIVEMGRSCRIPVIEDAAQALGAQHNGRMAGTFSEIGCYSFYPTKNLGGAGDGGMLVTNDARLAERLRRLRVHGSDRRYYHDEVGVNSRLDEIQAAVLRVKLRYLDAWNLARQQHAEDYNGRLASAVRIPAVGPERAHVFHQYVIQVTNRDSLKQHLAGRGVETAIYYPVPLHLQKCFTYLGHKPGDFPNSEDAAQKVLALPMYPELTSDVRAYVADAVLQWTAAQSSTRPPAPVTAGVRN